MVHPEQVGSYLAKYLTKATEDFGLPAQVRSAGHARRRRRQRRTRSGSSRPRRTSPPRARTTRCCCPTSARWATAGTRSPSPAPTRSPSASSAAPDAATAATPPASTKTPTSAQILDDDHDIPDGFELVSSWVFVGQGYLDLDQAAAAVMSATLSRTR